MNPNREEALFALALGKPADKRADLPDAMCGGDPALRRRRDQTVVHPREQSDSKR